MRITAYCKCQSCGKRFEVEKACRNTAEGESWKAWAERNYIRCEDCTEEKVQEQLLLDERNHDMPKLTGSEKQVAWARKIRMEIIGHWEEAIQHLQAAEKTEQDKLNTLIIRERGYASLRDVTAAVEYIDTKTTGGLKGWQKLMVKHGYTINDLMHK